jgi:predicted DNA-binding transcriptional regulator AlpA
MKSSNELDRALTKSETALMVGLDESTMLGMVADGEFPAPVQMSKGSNRWMLSWIRAYIESRPRGLRAGLRGR